MSLPGFSTGQAPLVIPGNRRVLHEKARADNTQELRQAKTTLRIIHECRDALRQKNVGAVEEWPGHDQNVWRACEHLP